jgi:hypothetical protein
MAIRHLLPKRPAWLIGTAVAAIAAVAAYVIVAWRGTWAPGHAMGMALGIAAAVIVALDALYPLRRRLARWPLTNSQQWLQLHVYGGTLAFLLALLHVGFRWPTGPLGWSMAVTGLWSVASGIAGVYLQKRVPVVLATDLTVEATYERIPQLAERLQAEADRLIDGSQDMVQRVYQTDIRPSLGSLQPSWAYLVEVTGPSQRLAALRGLQAFVGAVDQARLEDLAAIVSEKYQLDVQYSLQRVLRQWLVLHVPAVYLFLGLLVLHVVLVLSF